jgi:hypothetical protein
VTIASSIAEARHARGGRLILAALAEDETLTGTLDTLGERFGLTEHDDAM